MSDPAVASLPPNGSAMSVAPNPTPSANGTKDGDKEHLITDAPSDNIHVILQRLRKSEIEALAQDAASINSVVAEKSYLRRFPLEITRYLRYFVETWFGMIFTTFFGGLGLFDYFTMWVYAFGGTVVLWFVLWFCLIANSPVLKDIYADWSKKDGGGLGIVNSSNPKIFKALTKDQAIAAKAFLSTPIKPLDDENVRHFNYDGANLQMAAIIYEHPNQLVRNAVRAEVGKDRDQDGVLAGLWKSSARLDEAKGTEPVANTSAGDSHVKDDSNIHDWFCDKHGLDFEPISELNNTSSAFAGLFWDPKSNWIVIAFKGTSPIEFGEWLSDLNTKLSAVGSHIPGFKRVHKGFKDRVYPADIRTSGGIRPYDTISKGVKALAEHLRKTNNLADDAQINIWFTGHSLGCATASLVYCRFLMRHKDMGKRSVLRDAYLYACPILTDRDTVDVFNAKMMEDKRRPKTMWRITSNGDFVATCLPELGDYTSVTVSPNNAFAFAHLGTEIKLRDGPDPPLATGNHLLYGTHIKFQSQFSMDDIITQRKRHNAKDGEKSRQRFGRAVQKIPFLGRLFAHSAVLYWDQLDRISLDKPAEWAYN